MKKAYNRERKAAARRFLNGVEYWYEGGIRQMAGLLQKFTNKLKKELTINAKDANIIFA